MSLLNTDIFYFEKFNVITTRSDLYSKNVQIISHRHFKNMATYIRYPYDIFGIFLLDNGINIAIKYSIFNNLATFI